jgi:hypothetical protein
MMSGSTLPPQPIAAGGGNTVEAAVTTSKEQAQWEGRPRGRKSKFKRGEMLSREDQVEGLHLAKEKLLLGEEGCGVWEHEEANDGQECRSCFLDGTVLKMLQYSVTEHTRHVDPGSGRGLPGRVLLLRGQRVAHGVQGVWEELEELLHWRVYGGGRGLHLFEWRMGRVGGGGGLLLA